MVSRRNPSRRTRGSGSIKVRTLADGVTKRYDAICWAQVGKQESRTFGSEREAVEHLRRVLGVRFDQELEANPRAVGRRSFGYYAQRFLRQKIAKGLLKPTPARD